MAIVVTFTRAMVVHTLVQSVAATRRQLRRTSTINGPEELLCTCPLQVLVWLSTSLIFRKKPGHHQILGEIQFGLRSYHPCHARRSSDANEALSDGCISTVCLDRSTQAINASQRQALESIH